MVSPFCSQWLPVCVASVQKERHSASYLSARAIDGVLTWATGVKRISQTLAVGRKPCCGAVVNACTKGGQTGSVSFHWQFILVQILGRHDVVSLVRCDGVSRRPYMVNISNIQFTSM